MSAIRCLQKRIYLYIYIVYILFSIYRKAYLVADDGQVTRAVATLLHFALRNRMLVYSSIFSCCCCVTLYLYRATHSKNWIVSLPYKSLMQSWIFIIIITNKTDVILYLYYWWNYIYISSLFPLYILVNRFDYFVRSILCSSIAE